MHNICKIRDYNMKQSYIYTYNFNQNNVLLRTYVRNLLVLHFLFFICCTTKLPAKLYNCPLRVLLTGHLMLFLACFSVCFSRFY